MLKIPDLLPDTMYSPKRWFIDEYIYSGERFGRIFFFVVQRIQIVQVAVKMYRITVATLFLAIFFFFSKIYCMVPTEIRINKISHTVSRFEVEILSYAERWVKSLQICSRKHVGKETTIFTMPHKAVQRCCTRNYFEFLTSCFGIALHPIYLATLTGSSAVRPFDATALARG